MLSFVPQWTELLTYLAMVGVTIVFLLVMASLISAVSVALYEHWHTGSKKNTDDGSDKKNVS